MSYKPENILADAVALLGEHFDAVQIVASTTEGDTTDVFYDGCGNMYARVGMVEEFLCGEIDGNDAEWHDSE